ncbi:hypothetical protein HanRHA438_Chr17g0811291 [Helianthus annuus]|uniref:DUF4283 domain-containing protein n=1 Tax=Helianthus annuus TaxID=4232 RepID=A0A9K3GUI5_HELAN|nr:hypothetical protein HanXRQr2_Chr17g0801331 [Helianthus annuus]KAJ0429087.1 hypothetical protein HanHA300_Chr17g0653381 [Helianthus annuus]KAJ0433321.1 hypothetical protein HanIR_Chr17g0868971 [Helianthus annuus]KAJ0447401.1 hypothetical protein HanHA89_Chr17g0704981 [Helianthus annuus]KAJ0632280.1 hypothetical protein HanLR1_Chr17g0663381 [Helianthus annuus]
MIFIITKKIIDVAPNACAFSDWFDVAIVAKVKEFNHLIELRKNLVGIGFSGVEIRYMGGFFVLLKFENKEEANMFMMDKEVWSVWFHKMEIWMGQSLPYERVAWLKIYGVPLNLSMSSVFNAIGNKFGKVVKLVSPLEEEMDLSFACVGVLTKMVKKVDEVVVVRWQNKNIEAWVEEEHRDWVPDCLLEEVEDGESDNSLLVSEEEVNENMFTDVVNDDVQQVASENHVGNRSQMPENVPDS